MLGTLEAMLVDDDAPAFVELHPGIGHAEVLRIGSSTDGDQQHVAGLLTLPIGRCDRRAEAVGALRHLRQRRAQREAQALLLQRALQQLGHRTVHAGNDAVEPVDHPHFGAEA
jgi:hypothetical protein